MPRKRASDRPLVAQDAPLLRLPPEIRNEIYILVATDDNVAVRVDERYGDKDKVLDPPLTQVCRQIRYEALEVYRANAPTMATNLTFHLRNFRSARLQEVLAPWARHHARSDTKYTFHFHLDKFFNTGREVLEEVLRSGGSAGKLRATFVVAYNPKSLDVETVRKCLESYERKTQLFFGRAPPMLTPA